MKNEEIARQDIWQGLNADADGVEEKEVAGQSIDQ